MLSSDAPILVVFTGGFSARWPIVQRLLTLEAHGCRFTRLADGRFRVDPPEHMTAEDRAFFRANRDRARQVLAYCEQERVQ